MNESLQKYIDAGVLVEKPFPVEYTTNLEQPTDDLILVSPNYKAFEPFLPVFRLIVESGSDSNLDYSRANIEKFLSESLLSKEERVEYLIKKRKQALDHLEEVDDIEISDTVYALVNSFTNEERLKLLNIRKSQGTEVAQFLKTSPIFDKVVDQMTQRKIVNYIEKKLRKIEKNEESIEDGLTYFSLWRYPPKASTLKMILKENKIHGEHRTKPVMLGWILWLLTHESYTEGGEGVGEYIELLDGIKQKQIKCFCREFGMEESWASVVKVLNQDRFDEKYIDLRKMLMPIRRK